MTAPDILICTAVLASSAVPGVLPAVELKRKRRDGTIVPYVAEGKRWRDGSLRIDIPLRKLHQILNVNYPIVSQVVKIIQNFFFIQRLNS